LPPWSPPPPLHHFDVENLVVSSTIVVTARSDPFFCSKTPLLNIYLRFRVSFPPPWLFVAMVWHQQRISRASFSQPHLRMGGSSSPPFIPVDLPGSSPPRLGLSLVFLRVNNYEGGSGLGPSFCPFLRVVRTRNWVPLLFFWCPRAAEFFLMGRTTTQLQTIPPAQSSWQPLGVFQKTSAAGPLGPQFLISALGLRQPLFPLGKPESTSLNPWFVPPGVWADFF